MALLNRYLLDTNILVHYSRQSTLAGWIEARYQLQTSPVSPFLSEVSVAEVLSLTLQRGWGKEKQRELQRIIDFCTIVPISFQGVHQAYAQIDYFSQKSPDLFSAKNMGKNDLWIAATAHVANVPLITTDKDFNHLHPDWITLEYVDPDSVKKGIAP